LLSVARAAFALTLVLSVAAPAAAQDWPAFRGPDATGVAGSARPPVLIVRTQIQLVGIGS
jgi:hypothetical protein